eukprot:14352284-Ditylum_brightwellii.AAC.1
MFDGPTLIWVILTTLKQTKNVGVQSEICAIKSAKLSGNGNGPLKMLDGMELKFNLIKDISGESVLTTKHFTVQLVQTHYFNNKNEFDAVDLKDTAIVALTTKLNSLEGKLKNQGGSNSSKGSSGSTGSDNNKRVENVIKTTSKTMDHQNGALKIKA